MSDSVVKSRTMGDRIEVVGLSIRDGVRNLQSLAAANHGWAPYLVEKRNWMSTRAS